MITNITNLLPNKLLTNTVTAQNTDFNFVKNYRLDNSDEVLLSSNNNSNNKNFVNTYQPRQNKNIVVNQQPENAKNTISKNEITHLEANQTEEKNNYTNSDDLKFRELFHKFVGQVLFGQMLKSMRATQQKNPYFHGGRTEEIFQDELDNKLVEQLTISTTKKLSEPMYNQFIRQRFNENI
ncbi:MAG: rod-binding protein [Planctomycetaceae bacterium]|jgi:hypothetical protein|nr:rod-binding protein [Planctomycetaceae bacterium]